MVEKYRVKRIRKIDYVARQISPGKPVYRIS